MTTIDIRPDFDDASYREPNPFHDTAPILDPDRDSWAPTNLALLPEQPPIEPTLGGIGLVYPGKRHVFSGPPESAKTIAAYVIGLRIVQTGGTWVLIDFEMGGYDARNRLRDLGATTQDLNAILYLEPNEPATKDRIQHLVQLTPSLVTIDAAAGAYDLEGLDDNKRADVEKLSRLYVREFWQAGIATIFVDHVVKNSETRGRFVIGSERKLGGADVHIGFDTIQAISRGTNGRYKITTHKDRGGYLKRGHILDLHLTSDPETHAIEYEFRKPTETVADADYFRPTHLMEKVSAWLELQSEPAKRKEILDAVGGNNDYVLKAITALKIEGYVVEDDGPRGAKLARSVKPYREADDQPPTPPIPAIPTHSAPIPECDSVTHSMPFPPLQGKGQEGDASGTPKTARPIPDDPDADIPF